MKLLFLLAQKTATRSFREQRQMRGAESAVRSVRCRPLLGSDRTYVRIDYTMLGHDWQDRLCQKKTAFGALDARSQMAHCTGAHVHLLAATNVYGCTLASCCEQRVELAFKIRRFSRCFLVYVSRIAAMVDA